MDIKDFNEWWKTGDISEDYKKLNKRVLFEEIIKYLKNRQIIVITGLRRVGKTVLMHHIIDYLLKIKISPNNIVYFNFDLSKESIEEILKEYKEITNVDYKKENIFVFLDEIQKLENWQDNIKGIYDNYRNIKFLVSGSSSLFIEKKTKESLAGRSFDFKLLPLNFKEYLELKNKIELLENPLLYDNQIKGELKKYTISGGFPELIDEEDEVKIKKYVKELIIDKVIYIDIPKVFEIEEPELLQSLISIVSSSPGIIVDYESLANDLKRNRKTISNYLFYLEKSFILKKVYNFSRNLLTGEKKKKRFYPSTTALTILYNADYGKVIETLVLQNSDFKFFYRKNSKEVDFIHVNEKVIVPVEVKTKKKIDKRIKINMLDFMKRFDIWEGIVLTEDYEGEEETEWFGTKRKIKFIPLWKWLLK